MNCYKIFSATNINYSCNLCRVHIVIFHSSSARTLSYFSLFVVFHKLPWVLHYGWCIMVIIMAHNFLQISANRRISSGTMVMWMDINNCVISVGAIGHWLWLVYWFWMRFILYILWSQCNILTSPVAVVYTRVMLFHLFVIVITLHK